jgi:hypothetical protein
VNSSCLTFAGALTPLWVGNSIYEYNGSTYDALFYTTAVLEPWKAYWIQAGNAADLPGTDFYDLIVPGP